MASKLFRPQEDLSCPVCYDIFKDPVVLSCSHSFCKACMQEYWKDKRVKLCPVCRIIYSKESPPCNLVLKNLCESFLQDRSQRSSSGSEVLCSLHSEKLKLFCLDDKEPLCLVCQTSRKHKKHSFCPIDKAVQDQKDNVKTALKTIKHKLELLHEDKMNCEETVEHVKIQTQHTEKLIKEEFKKLHQFLQEEEEARISALKDEEQQKSQMMNGRIKVLSKEISTLSGVIRAIEEDLRVDDISFLQNYKATVKRTKCTLPDPQLVSGALIDVAKHLGNLTFRVWEKMKERVTFTPVILDPNTAYPTLSLSDDLTCVRYTNTKQQLPDNPERNTMYPIILASEGFSSGHHSWDVEVGDHPVWLLGVVKESLNRKGELFASPDHGIWALLRRNGKCTNGLGETVIVKRRLQMIRVNLDFSRGEVSFYDLEHMTYIYTYKHTFTEKLYPYFSFGVVADPKHSEMKISQSEVSLSY